jgi:hypothetical protein
MLTRQPRMQGFHKVVFNKSMLNSKPGDRQFDT